MTLILFWLGWLFLALQKNLCYGATGSYRCTPSGCFPTGKEGGMSASPQPSTPQQKKSPPSAAAFQPVAKFHTPAPPPPPPRVFHIEGPAKKQPPPKKQPGCVKPAEFGRQMGMSAIRDCVSLKVMAERGVLKAEDDVLGSKCDWLENDDCGRGSHSKGSGNESAIARFRNRSEKGDCLVFDTKASEGLIRLRSRDDSDDAVDLCCTPVCSSEPSTTTTTTTITSSATRKPKEELLSLDEPPPSSPEEPTRPSVEMPTPTPYQPPPPEPAPPRTERADVLSEQEQCVDVKYLNFPRVETCEDLKDLAWSTDYIHVTFEEIFRCDWVEDYSCYESYPGHGSWLDAGTLDGLCLAYRDSVCGDLIGPIPILLREERRICQRKGRGHPKHNKGVPVMMVAQPQKKGHGDAGNTSGSRIGRSGRFLSEETMLAQFSELMEGMSEKRMLQPQGKKEDGLPSSTTIPLCCRLVCNSSSITAGYGRTRETVVTSSAASSRGGGGSSDRQPPTTGPRRASSPASGRYDDYDRHSMGY